MYCIVHSFTAIKCGHSSISGFMWVKDITFFHFGLQFSMAGYSALKNMHLKFNLTNSVRRQEIVCCVTDCAYCNCRKGTRRWCGLGCQISKNKCHKKMKVPINIRSVMINLLDMGSPSPKGHTWFSMNVMPKKAIRDYSPLRIWWLHSALYSPLKNDLCHGCPPRTTPLVRLLEPA